MIVGFVIFTVAFGAVALLGVSRRLRSEIAALFLAFDHTERSLVPLIVSVRSDRDRLAERLARFHDTGTGSGPTRR